MTTPRRIHLLDADPELGRLLQGQRLVDARRELLTRIHSLERGPWDAERLRSAGPEHVGLLLIDGVVAREIALEDNVSAELLGPGDIVRPWQAQPPSQLMRAEVRWTIVEEARFAILDRHFAVQLARYPEVNAMLIDRLTERAQRLAMTQAISQLNGVERRLLALFWHLSERWGRVIPDGISVPVPLPHRVIAQLVGARRPTVSTALGHLAERGELVRRPDGGWLLTGEPVGVPTEEAARVIRSRRRRFPTPTPEPVRVPAAEPAATLPEIGRIADLYDALDALKADNKRHREDFQSLREEAAALVDRISAQRESRRLSRTRGDG
ncbi:MAG TPA: Crp/Fnr family transcriptional regulator [Solirubrobacteraceae bacterium]|nr:Crp/Fnr family transcriptional regulator [Solirubrobacteraceae bacterium]